MGYWPPPAALRLSVETRDDTEADKSMMNILSQPLRRNRELDPGPAILGREDAAVARHQGSQQFSQRLAVPTPDLIREALNLRLLSPDSELRQPTDDRTLCDRPPDTVEVRSQAFSYSQPAHARPRGDVVRQAALGDVAAWK